MKREISAGAIIFRREPDGSVKFLLLYYGRNYWNFPKGRLEKDEKVTAAFLREVEEETGLRHGELKILSGFRATERYMFTAKPSRRRPQLRVPERIFKIVIFYLVETKKREVKISWEHEGFGWFTYHEALHIAKFKNTKDILKRAYDFIQNHLRRHPTHSQRPRGHLR